MRFDTGEAYSIRRLCFEPLSEESYCAGLGASCIQDTVSFTILLVEQLNTLPLVMAQLEKQTDLNRRFQLR